jgi:hypothetical protein
VLALLGASLSTEKQALKSLLLSSLSYVLNMHNVLLSKMEKRLKNKVKKHYFSISLYGITKKLA